LNSGEYNQVLDILRAEQRPELYYRYGPELMRVLPEHFVDAIITGESHGNLLSPTKVLPALVIVSEKHQELQVIR